MGAVSCWMSVPSACLSAHFGWLLLPVTGLLVGKELKVLRSHNLAEVGKEQLWVRTCFQEDAVDTRAIWPADTSSSFRPHHSLVRTPTLSYHAIFPQSLRQAHLYTMLTPWSHGMIKVGKHLQHQVCPTTPRIFLPTFSVSCKFFLVSLSSLKDAELEELWLLMLWLSSGVWAGVLFVLVVNKTWWMDKQLPQSPQSV